MHHLARLNLMIALKPKLTASLKHTCGLATQGFYLETSGPVEFYPSVPLGESWISIPDL